MFFLSGCSTVSTQPDQVALHFEDGPLSSKKFKDCVRASKRDFNGPGDKYYLYPTGQRSFDFTGDKDAESGPITVTAKGQNVEGVASGVAAVNVPGVVSFTLNTECGILRQFHEQIASSLMARSPAALTVGSPAEGIRSSTQPTDRQYPEEHSNAQE